MSYLRGVLFFGFLSRQTIFLFVLSIVAVLPLLMQARAQSHACGVFVSKTVAPAMDDQKGLPVGFDPCFIWREPGPAEKTGALESFVFLTGFSGSFVVDLIWGVRRHGRRWGEIVGRMFRLGS